MTKTCTARTRLDATFPGHYPRAHIPPTGFSAMELTTADKQWLEQQALEIFAAVANKRRPFADCLASVFLTGLHFGAMSNTDQA